MENPTITPEEAKAEQEALAEAKEEEIRAAVITDYGFDEVDDAERIDKMVAEKMESHKTLSHAIGQKAKYRADLQELQKVAKPPQDDKANVLSPEEFDQKLDEKLNERLEKRDLDSMGYSPELNAEISKVAKIQGVSVKKAVQDPYIVSRIETEERERETDKATISRTYKSGGKIRFSVDNPPELDYSTVEKKEESEKKYQEWKDWTKTQPGYENPK